MLLTAEVRWFFPGKPDAAVLEWYRSGDANVVSQPARVDYYLPVIETDGFGLKYREGRIESKQRYASRVPTSFGPQAVGRVETWRKWGFDLAAEQTTETFESLDAWVAVKKRRLMRNYALRDEGRLVPIPIEMMPDRGCSVELSHVEACGEVWWTLAFEAVGPEASLVATLESVARAILTDAKVVNLQLSASYGYPRWLWKVAEVASPVEA